MEANLVTLRTELAEAAKELQEETRNRTEAVESERRTRESEVKELRMQLEGFGAGSLHVEMAGVFWVILGIVLATASSEIAGALKWFQ